MHINTYVYRYSLNDVRSFGLKTLSQSHRLFRKKIPVPGMVARGIRQIIKTIQTMITVALAYIQEVGEKSLLMNIACTPDKGLKLDLPLKLPPRELTFIILECAVMQDAEGGKQPIVPRFCDNMARMARYPWRCSNIIHILVVNNSYLFWLACSTGEKSCLLLET